MAIVFVTYISILISALVKLRARPYIYTVKMFSIKKSNFREKEHIFTDVYFCLNPIELVIKLLKLGSKQYNLQTNKRNEK